MRKHEEMPRRKQNDFQAKNNKEKNLRRAGFIGESDRTRELAAAAAAAVLASRAT